MNVTKHFFSSLCLIIYLFSAFAFEPEISLPIPVIEENNNITSFLTTPIPSMPLTSSISSIFPSAEISWQLPTIDQMLTQRTFFGFPPLIPLGMEITTSKNEENLREKVLKKEMNNSTVKEEEQECSKSCFPLSKQAGIKVRFNPPIFDNVAHFFHNILNEEAKQLQISPQKHCFQEGCFRLHTFQIVNFQKPEIFTLKPLGPNLLLLNIASFDVNIESMLSGNIQFLLFTPMPVSGYFYADAQELSIKALLGLQKDGKKISSLRIINCELIDGIISTKITDLGLFTDSINLKYKEEILAKARALITSTICDTISKTIQNRVNRVLRKLPSFLSVSDILITLFGKFNNTDDVKNGYNITTTTFSDSNVDKILDFFDLNLLKRLLINLEFLDSFASEDYFSVGLIGDVLIVKNQTFEKLNNNNPSLNDNDLLFNFENTDDNSASLEIDNIFDDNNLQNISKCKNIIFNTNNNKNVELMRKEENSMEIIFSHQLVNNVLLKAFRANLLSINVGQNSFLFGPLLRTSCDLDNICLGDSMPEANDIYPNEQLELKILPTETPILNFTEDLAIFTLSGVGIFFLARNRLGQPIARIPFSTIFELNIGNEKVSLSIPKLEIHENVDFFNVSPKILQQEGFVNSVRNVIINFAKKLINSSTDILNILEHKLCGWGILNPKIKLLNNGFVVLSIKEFNVNTLFKK